MTLTSGRGWIFCIWLCATLQLYVYYLQVHITYFSHFILLNRWVWFSMDIKQTKGTFGLLSVSYKKKICTTQRSLSFSWKRTLRTFKLVQQPQTLNPVGHSQFHSTVRLKSGPNYLTSIIGRATNNVINVRCIDGSNIIFLRCHKLVLFPNWIILWFKRSIWCTISS